MMALLVLAQVLGLMLIPIGLPGVWVQVLAVLGFAWATGFERVGWGTLLLVVALAAAAEVVEFVIGGRYAARYGGSRRAVWGAILGGLVGAVIGVPIFLIGSVIGAFVGAFAGALLAELSATRDWRRPEWRGAVRVGYGAIVGRFIATGVKGLFGMAIGLIAVVSALG